MSKKKSDSITLSPKYGVNPTMPLCFFCGEEKNEIALLGKLPGDAKAPRHMWIPGDYTPCDKCREKWDKGIALIEASETPEFDNQPAMDNGCYPTGRVLVAPEDTVRKTFKPEVSEDIVKRKIVCMSKEVIDILTGNKKED
jgi:hypothetical protein